jgi:hypothetical protein
MRREKVKGDALLLALTEGKPEKSRRPKRAKGPDLN